MTLSSRISIRPLSARSRSRRKEVISLHLAMMILLPQRSMIKYRMYNFSMAVAGSVEVTDKGGMYKYAVNISMAVFECLNFFRRVLVHTPPDGEALMERIASNTEPVRPGRKDERKMQNKGAVIFWYRIAA